MNDADDPADEADRDAPADVQASSGERNARQHKDRQPESHQQTDSQQEPLQQEPLQQEPHQQEPHQQEPLQQEKGAQDEQGSQGPGSDMVGRTSPRNRSGTVGVYTPDLFDRLTAAPAQAPAPIELARKEDANGVSRAGQIIEDLLDEGSPEGRPPAFDEAGFDEAAFDEAAFNEAPFEDAPDPVAINNHAADGPDSTDARPTGGRDDSFLENRDLERANEADLTEGPDVDANPDDPADADGNVDVDQIRDLMAHVSGELDELLSVLTAPGRKSDD
jgi:hypothetical protein